MNLSSSLVNIKQRETGGETAQKGFDYQACCAVVNILELEAKKEEYVILLEYHDDILILNSESNPNKVKFIQVKTKKKGNWTEGGMIKVNKGSLSILSKLYLNKKNFDKYDVELNFVTNADFSFSSEAAFLLSDVKNNKIREKITEAIKKQLDIDSVNEDCLRFIISDLSLEDCETHLTGKVNQFISDHIDSGLNVNSIAITKTLMDLCRVKSKASKGIHDLQSLIDTKGIKSTSITGFFNGVKLQNEASWERAKPLFSDLLNGNPCLSYKLIMIEAQYRCVLDVISNEDSVYHKYLLFCNMHYSKSLIEMNFIDFINKTKEKANKDNIEFDLLNEDEKTCILIYSILSNVGIKQ